ncbi:MAG: TraR/DksA C4-type zinc finger protein [Rhodocyclaceae bacterium]|nr:TraR/DksA C4-type zinc finger protein [Rhodocyclaceae bacterium]
MIETEQREVGDWIDAAVASEESVLAGALEDQRLTDPTRGKTVDDSAWECEAWGDPIPQERREAVPGVRCCTSCQRAIEVTERQHRR